MQNTIDKQYSNYGFNKKKREVKLKKPKLKLKIKPFFNYLDDTNTEFMAPKYKQQTPLLKLNP